MPPDPALPAWAIFANTRLTLPATDSDSLVDLALLISFAAYALLGLAILLVARIHGGPAWRDLLAWSPWNPGKTSRGVWLLFAAALVYGFVADLALRHFYPPSESWFSIPKDFFRASAIFILAVVIAPVIEELIFRGYLYTILRPHLGLAATLLITSAVFAALHYESTHLYAVIVFPIGIVLGLVREIAGSIKPAIAFHAFNNFLALSFALFEAG
jgi:membrane protease YdiL (CAAX protease family)